MTRADDFPDLRTAMMEFPSSANPLGAKGAGESGTQGAPPAVINAIVDALSDYGVRHIDMPATAMRIWDVMQKAKAHPGKERQA